MRIRLYLFEMLLMVFVVNAWLPKNARRCQMCLPATLTCGEFIIDATQEDVESIDTIVDPRVIRLVDIGSGWGDGQHPSTRLCLDFVDAVVQPGQVFLDYGAGSGILSILAGKKGAQKVIAVDIDEDCLRASRKNVAINGLESVVEVLHTARVCPGDLSYPLADVTVANILPGALMRLVAALWMSTRPGGYLCLCGLRPAQLPAVRRCIPPLPFLSAQLTDLTCSMYLPFVNIETESIAQASHDRFGTPISVLI